MTIFLTMCAIIVQLLVVGVSILAGMAAAEVVKLPFDESEADRKTLGLFVFVVVLLLLVEAGLLLVISGVAA